jgi:hypothetical protein
MIFNNVRTLEGVAMYIKNGDRFWPTNSANTDIHKHLGSNVYEVMFDPDRGFYLKILEKFVIPSKLYGDVTSTADRIMKTYVERKGTTGVLLEGLKGSGKTMLSKLVSAKAGAALNIPTVLIGSPFKGPAFINLLKDIGEAVLIFDEFEKMYDNNMGEQNELLSLFDGVFTSRSLILVTCNNSYRVSEFFKNRPGRIYYSLSFQGLKGEFIQEYCQDRLNNKSHIPQILDLAGLAGNYSFDMLQALVEEMNRYNESPMESMKFLNFKSDISDTTRYNVQVTFQGSVIEAVPYRGFPLMSKTPTVYFKEAIPDGIANHGKVAKPAAKVSDDAHNANLASLTILEDEDDEYEGDSSSSPCSVLLSQEMLISKDHANQVYTYKHPSGAVFVFSGWAGGDFTPFDAM